MDAILYDMAEDIELIYSFSYHSIHFNRTNKCKENI